MKDSKSIAAKPHQFYNSSQNYMERLDRHDEKTFSSYLQTCKAIIPADSSILDCGCGTGFSSYLLAESGFHVTGIDMSSLFISEAQKRYVQQSDLNFLMADVSIMPFHSNSFDSVCSYDLLEHVTDVKGTLEEMCRIVKTGGSVIIFMPNHLDPAQHLVRCIRWKIVDNLKPWEARTRITALYQFIRTIFLIILKAVNINRKIYYLEPVVKDDANVCGQDYDATWLTNRYDVAHILKKLEIETKYISSQKFEDRLVRKMRRMKVPETIQFYYTKMRASYLIVGVKK